MKICIDPGHGGSDSGAIGEDPHRLEEKEVNLAVSLFLEQELISLGHQVVMTRRVDRTLGLGARSNFANRLSTDFFVSIHTNSAANASAEGMEVFHYEGSSAGEAKAVSVLDMLLKKFPDHKNRGVKTANFSVLRRTLMPAILVELEFVTNPKQLRFLDKVKNQAGLAQAIAEGIIG